MVLNCNFDGQIPKGIMVKPKAAKAARTPGLRRAADSAERAYRAIRQLLVEFKIRPEERINEVQLAQQLELSRTPVREALNRLASEGFVVVVPNKGYFFRSLEIDDLVDLFETRSIIETGAFALACERADKEGIARLRAFWEDARRRYANNDPDEILDLDEGFHVRLAELSNNPEIVRQLTTINARIRFVRRVQIENVPARRGMAADHSKMVQALIDRDAAMGAAILKAHISLTLSEAQAILKEALLKIYVSKPLGSARLARLRTSALLERN